MGGCRGRRRRRRVAAITVAADDWLSVQSSTVVATSSAAAASCSLPPCTYCTQYYYYLPPPPFTTAPVVPPHRTTVLRNAIFYFCLVCVRCCFCLVCVHGGGGAVQVCCKFGLILGQCFLYALLVCGDVQEGAGWGSCYFTGGSYGVVSVCKRVNWGIQVAFCACGA